MTKTKPMTISMQPSVREELDVLAMHMGISRSAVIAVALQEYSKQVARAIVEKEPFTSMVDKTGRREKP